MSSSSIDKIIDGIYLGDIRAANNLFSLKSKGVTHRRATTVDRLDL